MNDVRSIIKVVAAQALGVFVVFNIVIWTICLGFTVANLGGYVLRPYYAWKHARRAQLPNYAGAEWAYTHFVEFGSLSTRYRSYIGWRREPFQGKTITLTGPYGQRATVGSGDPGKPSVYFFGGSTMWGTGSDDANTIPSLVTQIGGFRAANYGESAYTAHQSLVLLIQLLQEGHRPDIVVFYDGANDVSNKCRSELTAESHAREAQINSALASQKSRNAYDLRYMAGPLIAVARMASTSLLRTVNENRYFICHTDPRRAQQVADFLIQDWDVAARLVKSYGGKFIGILQPIAFFSNTKLDHLHFHDVRRKQFEAVYPLIKKAMAGHSNLYDFTGVLDRSEYIYIDFCHLSPNGNRYIARKIVDVLTQLG